MVQEKQIKWEKYQEAYNKLSDELIDAGIDYLKLKAVVDFLQDYLV